MLTFLLELEESSRNTCVGVTRSPKWATSQEKRTVIIYIKIHIISLIILRSRCVNLWWWSDWFCTYYFLWANPGLFFIYFRLFNQTIQILHQINVNKCPSSIWRWDSNSQPSVYKSPPSTTRPGLPPCNYYLTSDLLCVKS